MSLRRASAAMLLLLISAAAFSAGSAAVLNQGDFDTPPILRTGSDKQGAMNMPLFTYLRNKYPPHVSASAGASIFSSKSGAKGKLMGEVSGPKGSYGLTYQGLLPNVGNIHKPSYGASVHVAYPTEIKNAAFNHKLMPVINLLSQRYSSEEQGNSDSNFDSKQDMSRSLESNESDQSGGIKVYHLDLPQNGKTHYQKLQSGTGGQDISDILEAYINRAIISNGYQDDNAESRGGEQKLSQIVNANEMLWSGVPKHFCPGDCWHKSLDFASVPTKTHSIYLNGGQKFHDATIEAINRYATISENNAEAKSRDPALSPLILNLLGSPRGQLSKGEIEIQPKNKLNVKPDNDGTKPVDHFGDILYAFDVDEKELGSFKWLLPQK